MMKKRDPASLGRFVAKVKALWDLYWKVIVPGALHLDGKLKKRQARKKKEKEEREKKKKEKSDQSAKDSQSED